MLKYLVRAEQVLLLQLQGRGVPFIGVRNVNTEACKFEIFKGTWKTGTNLSQRKEKEQKVRRTE